VRASSIALGASAAELRTLVAGAAGATLLVLDDADSGAGAGNDPCELLRELQRTLAATNVLAVATVLEPAVREQLDMEVVRLEPLDADAAGAIAAAHAPAHAPRELPIQWLLEQSGGLPGRLHELAARWGSARGGPQGGRRRRARRERPRRAARGRGRAGGRRRRPPGGGGPRTRPDRRRHLVMCPYKGLAPFQADDAEYFFGRERLVAELVARLVGAPLLGVVGPSGSGKSSVLRAGLLPALQRGVLRGSGDWRQVVIRPGETPLRELRDATAGVADETRLVVVVDQFEETFTRCTDESERTAFVDELVRLAVDCRDRRAVVLAIRADHYGVCAAYPRLARLLAPNHVLVAPMSRDELRDAIERPAQRAGLRLDPALTTALVADVEGESGALPLLSTALLELWTQRDGRRLTHAAHERAGGVQGAVARLAENAFDQLDPAHRKAARSVLLRLVAVGEDGTVERRRAALAEDPAGRQRRGRAGRRAAGRPPPADRRRRFGRDRARGAARRLAAPARVDRRGSRGTAHPARGDARGRGMAAPRPRRRRPAAWRAAQPSARLA
jgi:hypothetical protein